MYGPRPDPYGKPGYGGGGHGGGGYGGGYGPGYGGRDFFNDCCGPNLIPIVAGVLLFIVYCLFIPGFAAPYWVSYEVAPAEEYFGIWSRCEDTNTAADPGANCTDWTDASEVPDWMTATEALMCISLISMVLATALLIYWLCSYSRYFFVKAIFICLLFLAFLLSLIGVIIFGANATDMPYQKLDFDWCFYLVDVSTSVLLFVPILLICVPSRESFPSYGPRDTFGFQHPRPPPQPMGGPMGPRPGYGMAEPIAHVYPNSLPRVKPQGYGGGYGGGGSSYPYPSMPYSSRY